MHSLKWVGLGFVMGALAVAGINGVNASHHEKPAYLIVNGETLDPEKMGPYSEAAGPLARELGLQVLARTDSVTENEILEGEWQHKGFVVVEKFPSMQALKDFWYSEAYQAAIPLREEGVRINFILALEGVD